jgi:shikimate dehydrogenase
LGAGAVAWDFGRDGAATAALQQADIIVQATSAGMQGVGGGAALADVIPWTNLRRDAFVYDLVYNPPETAVLATARRSGVPHSGGLGMLVRQAALALELWLDQTPPLTPMHDAAQRALFGGA